MFKDIGSHLTCLRYDFYGHFDMECVPGPLTIVLTPLKSLKMPSDSSNGLDGGMV